MLAKTNILKRDKEFENVFQNGKSSYNEICGVRIIKNQLKDNLFGIIISRKVSKSAVVRNRLKRQIRTIINSLEDKTKDGYDILIIASPEAKNNKYEEIKQAIAENFKKLRILK